MPELDNTNTGKHLQEYFAGAVAKPPNAERVVTMVTGAGGDAILNSESDFDEIARLRALVHEKDHAMFRAVLSANELRTQLEETRAEADSLKIELAKLVRQQDKLATPDETPGSKQALTPQAQEEIARLKKEHLRVQRSLEQENIQRKAELVQVRGQWFATQQQLEQEMRGRRAERSQTASKITSLERSLEIANATIASLRSQKENKGGKRGLVLAAVCVSVLLLVAGGLWTQFPVHAGSRSIPNVSSVPPVPSEVNPPQRKHSIVFSGTQKGLQGSIGRVNVALSAMSWRPPEEVLREVRKKSGDPSICAFQWNNGQPAVTFNGGGMKEPLSASLDRCAMAIQRLE